MEIKVEFEGKTIIYDESRGVWVWRSKDFNQLKHAKDAIEKAGIKKAPDFAPFEAFTRGGHSCEPYYKIVVVTGKAKAYSWSDRDYYWTTDGQGVRGKIRGNKLYELNDATRKTNQKIMELCVEINKLEEQRQRLHAEMPQATMPTEVK